MSNRWDSRAGSVGHGRSWAPEPPRAFNPWTVSLIAYLIRTGFCMCVLFVLALVGLVMGPFLGLAGAKVTEGGVLVAFVVVVVVVWACGIALQVRYIRRRGGALVVTACLAALAAALLLDAVLDLIGIPRWYVLLLGVLTEITIVALLTTPSASGAIGRR